MGPGCFHPRNAAGINVSEDFTLALQWGRDVSIPEMHGRWLRRRRCARFNGAGMFPSQKCAGKPSESAGWLASMGPGCFHPRNLTVILEDARPGPASMGPGCFHPRNYRPPSAFSASGSLQWGRDVSIPEMAAQSIDPLRAAPLQLGPDVSIPEIRYAFTATSFADLLQWGRDVSIPEMQCPAGTARQTPAASMGPGCFHPRNEPQHQIGRAHV